MKCYEMIWNTYIHICRFGNLPWTPNGFNLDIENKNIWEPTTRGIYAGKKKERKKKKTKHLGEEDQNLFYCSFAFFFISTKRRMYCACCFNCRTIKNTANKDEGNLDIFLF